MKVPVSRLMSEALRAMWSRPWLACGVVLVSATAGALAGYSAVFDANAAAHREVELLANGWSHVTVASAAGLDLDPAACRGAAAVSGVRRIGMVGSTTEMTALGLSAGLSFTEVTPDTVAIAWPDDQTDESASALMTPGFIALSGLSGGAIAVRAAGAFEMVNTGTLEKGSRVPELDGGVLLVRSELSSVQYCLIEVRPGSAEAVALEVAEATASYDTIAVPRLSEHAASPTPSEIIASHRARHVPLLAAMIASLASFARLLLLRRDRSVYRLLGVGRSDLWLWGLVDTLILYVVPVLSAFATLVLWGEASGISSESVGVYDYALVVALCVLLTVVAATGRAMGRNRHQFAPGA